MWNPISYIASYFYRTIPIEEAVQEGDEPKAFRVVRFERLLDEKGSSISKELHSRLLSMSKETIPAYDKLRPDLFPRRLSFLNYNYVLHKLCELLDEHETEQEFPLLRHPDNLRKHDTMWQAICKELHWVFIPTLLPDADLNTPNPHLEAWTLLP